METSDRRAECFPEGCVDVPMIGTEQERYVIGAVMLDENVLGLAADEVAPDDFYTPQMGGLFAGMLQMRMDGEPIDVATVMARYGSWDVRGITDADLHEILGSVPTAANVAFYAQAVADGAIRRRALTAAAQLRDAAESTGVEFGAALSAVVTQLQNIAAGSVRSELVAKPLGDVLAGTDDYDWAIPNLLERKDRVIVTGGEGAGKTTFVRQLAVLASAGIHPFTFFPIRPQRVLVVDAENSEKQWRRATRPIAGKAARAGSAEPATMLRLSCVRRMDLTQATELAKVHRLLDEYEPDLLFIGPLYRLVPRAIQSDDDAAPLLAALDSLRDRGPALIMEAHAGHSTTTGGERDLRPRGSSALMGWPEFGFGLRVDRMSMGKEYELVRWRGDRDQRDWPDRLQRGGMWPWVPVRNEFEETSNEQF